MENRHGNSHVLPTPFPSSSSQSRGAEEPETSAKLAQLLLVLRASLDSLQNISWCTGLLSCEIRQYLRCSYNIPGRKTPTHTLQHPKPPL